MIEHFHTPTSIEEAIKLKKENNSAYLAGGTQINSEKDETINSIIYLSKIISTNINESENELKIGGMVTIQSIVEYKFNNKKFDILREAASNITNRNIRNIATIGGNIAAQKSSSDLIPILMVLDSSLEIEDKNGKRKVSIREYVENNMDELILEISIPAPADNSFTKVKNFARTKNDIAIVNLAINLELDKENIKNARISGGSLAPKPIFFNSLSEKLSNSPIVDGLKIIEENYRDDMEPIDNIRASSWLREEITNAYLQEMFEEIIEESKNKRGEK